MTGTRLAEEIRAFEPWANIILLSQRTDFPPEELVYIDTHIVSGSLSGKFIETIYTVMDTYKFSQPPANDFTAPNEESNV